ncbi:extracellular solute-binding protein [Paenibacillus rhizophilus]|uniref:Extracellular solute-binding protein n=1 Tax=Paenibacillus rhizophilus TaxID=1850366 RepID=A0A3N9PWR9_9BACL|nr:extracellular solute-binding protein [Paenibacillus rhizophilus]RQW09666.1 extracellular solute-binding protein [Paenibacillus rhizophilus]
MKSSFWKKGSLLLTALVIVLGGCSSGNNGANSGADTAADAAGSSEPVTITILKHLNGGQRYAPDTAIEKLIEEKANVKLEYQFIPAQEYDNKLNVLMAGGDLPDIIHNFGPDWPQYNSYVEQGAFLPLDDYLAKYPKVKEMVSDDVWNLLKSPKDGKIYHLPWYIGQEPQLTYYRKDWADKLAIKEPATVDEFTKMLEAFRDKDPDGNGKKDTIAFSPGDQNIWFLNSFMTNFGANMYGFVPSEEDPNTLVDAFIHPNLKTGLTYLHDLRVQGLLDPDWLVDKKPGIDKFIAGNVGVTSGTKNEYIRLVDSPNVKGVAVLPPLKGPNGYEGGARLIPPHDRGFSISSKAKNVDAIFKYLEWQLTDGLDLMKYGVLDKTYTEKDGVKTLISTDKLPDDYASLEVLREVIPQEEVDSLQKLESKFVDHKDQFEHLKTVYNLYLEKSKTNKYAADYRRPIASPANEQYGAKLAALVQEGLTKAIVDGKADPGQTFDNYVANYYKSGGQQVQDERNKLQQDKSNPFAK